MNTFEPITKKLFLNEEMIELLLNHKVSLEYKAVTFKERFNITISRQAIQQRLNALCPGLSDYMQKLRAKDNKNLKRDIKLKKSKQYWAKINAKRKAIVDAWNSGNSIEESRMNVIKVIYNDKICVASRLNSIHARIGKLRSEGYDIKKYRETPWLETNILTSSTES